MSYDSNPPLGSEVIKNADFRPCSDQALAPKTLPDNWRSDNRSELKCGVYEFEFNALEQQENIAVLVPSYRFNIDFYVNEIELSKSKGRRNQVMPFYTEVPAQMLNKGLNKFRIELLSDPKGEGFLDRVIIGEPAKLLALESRLVIFRHTLPQVIAIVILIFAGISLIFFLVEREAKEFLYFSLLSTSWVMNIFNMIWSDPIFSTYVWLKIVLCSVLAFGTFGCLFVGALLDVKFTRIDNAIKIMALIWFPLLILSPPDTFTLIGQFILMPYILFIGFVTAYKFFTKLKSTSILAVGDMYLALNTAIIVTGIHDVALMMNIIDNSIIFYLNYSAAGLILSIWFHMFSKYFQLLKLERNFSTVLKSELDSQKESLEASLKREKAAIEKSAALNERDNMMRDLHDSLGARLISLIRLSRSGRKTHKLAQETLDELRFMTTPLRVEDCDLVTLLATFREQRLRRLEEAGYKVRWSVEYIPNPPTWNTRQAMEFLRILDELLGNALKHGTDDELMISLVNKPQLKLNIANSVNVSKGEKSGGTGLNNIQIRSKKIGAEFFYILNGQKFAAEIRFDPSL